MPGRAMQYIKAFGTLYLCPKVLMETFGRKPGRTSKLIDTVPNNSSAEELSLAACKSTAPDNWNAVIRNGHLQSLLVWW